MGLDLKRFATDKNAEIEGVWVKLDEGVELKIARMGNEKFNELFRKYSRPYKRAIRNGTLSDSIAEDILLKCMSEAILLDWKGLEEDGVPLEYTKENAYRVLKEYEVLRDFVTSCAEDFELFKKQEDEEAEKN